MLGQIWAQNDPALQRAFYQWRAIWRSASTPVMTPAVVAALETWRAALDCKTADSFENFDDDVHIDVFFFLLQTLVAQTILRVVQTDFSLDDDTLQRLFAPRPFDWGAPARRALTRAADDLESLRLHELAKVRDPFGELYALFFSGPIRRALGEFYTPPDVAALLYGRALRGWREHSGKDDALPTVVDPTCGAGVFLTTVVRHTTRLPGVSPARALETVQGFDLSPLAAVATRANLLYAALAREIDAAPKERRAALERLLQERRARASDAPILPADVLDAVTLRSPFASRDATTPIPQTFDLALGNPPWLVWDRLSEEYRRETAPYWREYGLFTLSGRQARYGGGKKELAGLIVNVCAARRLRKGGVFSFVLPRSLFQTSSSGEGFRRFGAGKAWEFAALEIDDFSGLSLFPYVGSKAAALTGRVGSSTRYPIRARRWRPGAVRADSRFDPELVAACVALDATFTEGTAAPQDVAEPGAPLTLRVSVAERSLKRPCEAVRSRVDELVARMFEETRRERRAPRYSAKLGANAAGASGVFWFEGNASLDSETTTIRNLGDSGRRKVATFESQLETALLFPLLRWRDVGEFRINAPETFMLIPQDPERRRGYDVETMRARYPLTLEYLMRHEDALRARAAYRRYQSGAPFWSLYNVDASTFARIKVVWRRMDSTLRAAVVDYDARRNRPIVPQETLAFVAVATLDEADYLAATLNSEPARTLAAQRVAPGSRSFGTPGTLDAIPVTRYDSDSPICRELAKLGRQLRQSVDAPQEQNQ
ncbi:MAG: hypothetical protein II807_01320 [Thermoguttaceae bacterium]|nr:hypothetical protein [Thermoguttaceae bacterium]